LGTSDEGITPDRSNTEELVVVSCSRIAPVKRVHLIAAFAMELAKTNRVHWHHFGVGESLALKEVLQGATNTNFKYTLHGYVENLQLRSFYRSQHVDLFVNLSISEGIPVSIMEAISANIPVLATSVDGNPEAVVEGVSGVLCSVDEAEDAALLSERVRQMLVGRSSSLAPREVWRERFDARVNFPVFCKTLVEVARL
jgi:glycosyltransferase involved in cell wall biosynthesis